MGKAIKHTVVGAVGVRRSPRIYTHAIVAKLDYDARLRSAVKDTEIMSRDRFNWELTQEKTPVGQPFDKDPLRAWFTCKQEDKDGAAAFFAEHGRDLEAFVAKRVAKARADVEAARAKGEGVVHVLQWSQSASNASKALGSWAQRMYLDVHVEPVVRHA